MAIIINRKKKFIVATLLISLLIMYGFNAQAQIRVFACEPEWGALATELAGDRVNIFIATTAQQDPHHIEARPSLIAKMRRADIVVCTGAELEVGWLPLLLRTSGNKKVQVSQPGYFSATNFIETIEKPERLDRSLGDVHAAGNPHAHLDPYRLLIIAEALKNRFIKIDPQAASHYQQHFDDFKQRWQTAVEQWEKQASALKNTQAIVFHRNWAYLFKWLGIQRVAELEPIPGLPPSAKHLTKLKKQFADTSPDFIVYGPHQRAKPANWLSDQINSPVIELPFTVGGNKHANNLFTLYDSTIELLLSKLK